MKSRRQYRVTRLMVNKIGCLSGMGSQTKRPAFNRPLQKPDKGRDIVIASASEAIQRRIKTGSRRRYRLLAMTVSRRLAARRSHIPHPVLVHWRSRRTTLPARGRDEATRKKAGNFLPALSTDNATAAQ
jgi:hypothetical protein